MPHRPALEEAAEGHNAVRPGEVTRPDLEGVTHIPESELPERKPCVPLSLPRARAQRRRADLRASPPPSAPLQPLWTSRSRMERTALRPSDPNDPNVRPVQPARPRRVERRARGGPQHVSLTLSRLARSRWTAPLRTARPGTTALSKGRAAAAQEARRVRGEREGGVREEDEVGALGTSEERSCEDRHCIHVITAFVPENVRAV